MNILDLYNSISNPLDDDKIIESLFDCYSTGKSFYSNIVLYNTMKEYGNKKVGRYDNDLGFYNYIFNLWKNGIHYVVENNIKTNYLEDFIVLDKYLEGFNPHGVYEVTKILDGDICNDNKVKELLKKYRYDKYDVGSTWEFVKSNLVFYKSHDKMNVEHRLYINCDSFIISLLSKEFIKRCMENGLPFNFKFDSYGDRDDCFVVYSNTENLSKYYNILESIKNDYNLDNYIYEPSILTGKINSWIGYGSEPKISGKSTSYNSYRRVHINKCIHEVVGDYMMHNCSCLVIKDGDKNTLYPNYLLNEIVECIKEKTRNRRLYNKLSDEEIDSLEFKLAIYDGLKKIFRDILKYFKYDNSFNDMTIDYHGKSIYLTQNMLDSIFEEQVKVLSKDNKELVYALKNKLKKTCRNIGISDNYAIDIYQDKLFSKQIEKEGLIKDKEDIKIDSSKKEKVKKYYKWTPMTDIEIEESRRKLGLK